MTAGLSFLPPERFSAATFFGLLALGVPRLHQMRLGAYMGGMTEVMCEPLARGQRQPRRRGPHRPGGAGPGREGRPGQRRHGDGNRIEAEYVVLATSIEPAQRLLRPASAQHSGFTPWVSVPTTPSVTVQLELDRPAMDVDRTVFGPGTALACFADSPVRRSVRRPAVCRSSSPRPSRSWTWRPRTCSPSSSGTPAGSAWMSGQVTAFRVVSHPHDFTRSSRPPGTAARAKDAGSGTEPRGDYTRQKFMASMEGAVISGQRARRGRF